MNKKKLILCIGVIISIISIALTFLYYKSNNSLVIYTKNGSYAYNYAKRNMIKTINVSNSHYKEFYRVWEDFKYNEDPEGLIITKYEGISKELIIPKSYNNKRVIKIEKGALPESVEKVFLPDSVSIEKEDFNDIEILCYRGKYCEDLKDNNDLKVKVLDDVDRYILEEESLEFTYNIINNEIELTNYIGIDENVLVPESINGFKVTSINFDGEGIISIFIPETVTSISGNITSKLFNKCLITSIIIILLSLVVYCVSILLLKTYELLDKIYIYLTSIIYLLVVNYFVLKMRNDPHLNTRYLLYSIIASIVYVFVSYVLSIIIKNNNKYDNDIKHKNDFIKEVNLLIQDKDLDELKEISELIRYSDPVSIDKVSDLEKEIKDEIKSINKDNVKEKVKELKKIIAKRNTIIKDNK